MPLRGCLCGFQVSLYLVWRECVGVVDAVGAQLSCGNLSALGLCIVSELHFTDLYATDSVLLGVFYVYLSVSAYM